MREHGDLHASDELAAQKRAVEASLLASKIIEMARLDPKSVKDGPEKAAEWLAVGALGPKGLHLDARGILRIAAGRCESVNDRIARGDPKAKRIGTMLYFDKPIYEALNIDPPGAQAPSAEAALPAAPPQATARSPAEVARAAEKRARRNALGTQGRADLEEAVDALDKGDQAALQRCIQRLHQTRPYVLAALIEERPEVGDLYERMRQVTAAPTRPPESRVSTRS